MTANSTPPRDRPIMVRTREEGIWLLVRWAANRFDVVDGDGSWVLPEEVEAWREPPHPSIGIGTPA